MREAATGHIAGRVSRDPPGTAGSSARLGGSGALTVADYGRSTSARRVAVIGLTVAVVILASDENQLSDSRSAAPIGGTRYDGGPEEGTRGPHVSPPTSSLPAYPTPEAVAPGARYDGGPEEGTRGPFAAAGPVVDDLPSSPSASAQERYDGGPEEGTRGLKR